MQLGDARSGKLADNLSAFGRALRRAGLPVDPARIALAQQATLAVGLASKQDLSAALESVLVGREQDRAVFRELFDGFFKNPDLAQKLLSQLLPSAQGKAEPGKRRPRVREALAPQKALGQAAKPSAQDEKLEFDAAMTASDVQRLHHADFSQLGVAEYRLVERLARELPLPLPHYAARRTRAGARGSGVHWPQLLREAARSGGDATRLPRRQRCLTPLPLVVLVDVSGSMERYARLLLAFLHAATRHHKRRAVFAFGTQLTPLSETFRIADTDQMLLAAGRAIADFAGGTQLGASLAQLRMQHARCLVGRRTLVLLITDGLDTGENAVLVDELDWLKRHSGRLLWLNPLLRFEGYAPLARGAAALHQRADAMLAVHNLNRLEELARSLADLMKR
ncbi:MAG: vWA domain-containing protein [Burkholderiales bacterium]